MRPHIQGLFQMLCLTGLTAKEKAERGSIGRDHCGVKGGEGVVRVQTSIRYSELAADE